MEEGLIWHDEAAYERDCEIGEDVRLQLDGKDGVGRVG